MGINEPGENVAVRDGDLCSSWRVGASNGHTCQHIALNYTFPLEQSIGPDNCAVQHEFRRVGADLDADLPMDDSWRDQPTEDQK